MTIKNNLLASKFLLITFVIYLIAGLFLKVQTEMSWHDIGLSLILFSFLISLPAIYMHIEYYCFSKNLILEIDSIYLKVKKGVNEELYGKTELEKCILHKSASIDNNGIQMTPMESYRYVEIITKSNKRIIITNLMTSNIESVVKLLKDIPFYREKSAFCSIIK